MAATEVKVPDIGDFSDVPVIEVFVKAGDMVGLEDPVVSLESDKATMDVPSSAAGRVAQVLINVGDTVSEGTTLLLVETDGAAPDTAPAAAQDAALMEQQEPPPEKVEQVKAAAEASAAAVAPEAPSAGTSPWTAFGDDGPAAAHAGPSVRRLARELEVDLATITGSGPKGRITKEDLLASLRGGAGAAAAAAPAGGAGIPPIPAVDFSKFGETETVPLSRIRKISGPSLHRAWLNIPHVTNHDEADVTELEAYRKELDAAAKAEGYRVTLLSFLLRACAATLRTFPEFNSSLAPEGGAIILKKYLNIGVAVDTPDGLIVPVIRDVESKGITALSHELGTLSAKARDGKLTPTDISGGCFTISSLGGIGGTGFTPIINPPEVAILGVVRSKMTPVWDGAAFQPRLMLPLSLSWDHRVVDGAGAARFLRHLITVLEDIRRLVL